MDDNEDPDQSTVDSAAVEDTADGDKAADVELGLHNDLGYSLNEMANSLCSICRKFPRGQIEEEDWRVYHPSLTSLRESVQAGCWICKELTQSLDELCDRLQLRETLNETWFIQCKVLGNVPVGEGFHLKFFLCDSGINCAVSKFDNPPCLATIFFFPADSLGVGEEVLDHRLQISTAKSTTSINVARYWYHQCLSHPTCRSWRQDSRGLPTRLVRIWRPDNDSPDSISAELCETKNLPLNTAYVTLSHLWGDNQIFKLQQSNIEELRQSIRLNQLPRVFQDAMYVSIELGISYIWIDSLCIIQDSKEDWVCESGRMGDVYQYAACNIAASGIQDGSLGLFAERKALSRVHPSLFADFVLKVKISGRTIVFKGLYIRAKRTGFVHAIGGSILNSRAWVAQERALSPGIIHFTPEMMWWECNHGVHNEAFPTRDNEIGYAQKFFKICTIRSLTEKSDPEDIYAFWRRFIAHYAGKNLTFERDRFPAAVGIARTLSGLIDDNFIAGFWEGDLIRSLIMCRRGRIEDVPDTWRAPSWSWASLRTGYDTSVFDLVSHAQPLSGVSVRAISNEHGFKSDLDSASLEISDVRGLEITAPLRKLSIGIEAGFHDMRLEWFFDTWIDISNDSPAVKVSADQAWRLRDPTHLLVLAEGWYGNEDPRDSIAYALLVQQVPEAEEGDTFRRFGTAILSFHSDDRLKEYFGLQKENDQYLTSPIFGESGFQEIVLI